MGVPVAYAWSIDVATAPGHVAGARPGPVTAGEEHQVTPAAPGWTGCAAAQPLRLAGPRDGDSGRGQRHHHRPEQSTRPPVPPHRYGLPSWPARRRPPRRPARSSRFRWSRCRPAPGLVCRCVRGHGQQGAARQRGGRPAGRSAALWAGSTGGVYGDHDRLPSGWFWSGPGPGLLGGGSRAGTSWRSGRLPASTSSPERSLPARVSALCGFGAGPAAAFGGLAPGPNTALRRLRPGTHTSGACGRYGSIRFLYGGRHLSPDLAPPDPVASAAPGRPGRSRPAPFPAVSRTGFRTRQRLIQLAACLRRLRARARRGRRGPADQTAPVPARRAGRHHLGDPVRIAAPGRFRRGPIAVSAACRASATASSRALFGRVYQRGCPPAGSHPPGIPHAPARRRARRPARGAWSSRSRARRGSAGPPGPAPAPRPWPGRSAIWPASARTPAVSSAAAGSGSQRPARLLSA